MAKATNTKNPKTINIKNNLKYFFQSFVIILSVFISFFIDDIRKSNENIVTKNDLVSDLIVSLEDDLIQIDELIKILQKSEKNIVPGTCKQCAFWKEEQGQPPTGKTRGLWFDSRHKSKL